MRKIFAFSLALPIAATVGAAIAREAAPPRTNRVEIEYSTPKNPTHENIDRLMGERKVLERFRDT